MQTVIPKATMRMKNAGAILTIPKDVVDELSLEPGDTVELTFKPSTGDYHVTSRVHKAGKNRDIYLRSIDIENIYEGDRIVYDVLINKRP